MLLDQPTTLDSAKQLLTKLDALDSDFKLHHLAIVDLVEEDSLEAEQEALDRHDDEVAQLGVNIRKLIVLCTSSSDDSRKVPSK